ncbi:TolC family protein [Oscillibacter sp.]|uniref:TolC family protein n=1 Tax=Oscillibacter sp. TaxID=1945593 RepID=UPI0028A11EB0|nr:TolC family protein [Oscillibacter sp.]
MKRTLALLLAALLTMAAALPVLADDRAQSSAETAASSSSGTDAAGTDAGTDALPAASSGQTDAASPDASASGQTGDAAPAASVDVLIGSSVQNIQLSAENTAQTIHFEALRTALMRYNPTIQSLKAQLTDLNGTDTNALWNAVTAVGRLQADVESSLAAASAGYSSAPSELVPVYGWLISALQANYASLTSQFTTLKGQFDNIKNNVESGKVSCNDAINQIVKGAETLYTAIAAMEDGLGAMNRGLDSLNRAVAIAEKQHELGMASAYDAEKAQYQRSQLQSQIETLKFQVATNKVTLEGMCDMELTGSVSLGELSMPSQEELGTVNYDKMLSTALGRNADVANAEIAYDIDDSPANKHALAGAKDTFAAKFKVVCMAVPENVRLVSAAQETVDFQQRTFDIAAKKYELGMASHEEYLAAKNTLDSAQDDLNTAQRNLFSAYHAYESATKYGLV